MRKVIPILFLVAYFIACASKSVDSGVEGLSKEVYEFHWPENVQPMEYEIPNLKVDDVPLIQVWIRNPDPDSAPWVQEWHPLTGIGSYVIEDGKITFYNVGSGYDHRIVVIR